MGEALSFGEWLRHRRRELDLTQEELGHQLGCARITIRKLEADQMRPSRQLAELLGEYLGVSLGEREDFVHFARGGGPMKPILTTTPKHNLPKPVSSFIGREHEMAEVKRLMKRSRLVTLTGAGGSGKTRLALQVADQTLNQFPDGIYFVNLAPLSQSTLIQQTIASALGVREDPSYPLIQTLTDYLYSRNLLLLFDNCEHLLAECAQTAERLLQACPQLNMLVTSREALDIAGEEQFYVPTLTLPEAVQLFIERAEAVKSDFHLTDQNAAVVQICQHLDGIPLALELAAALVKGLSVEQIASRLDDRFHLLTNGSRTALPRQRTLLATIDWSYQLLSEEERRLLRQLSIFAGSWTLDAAEFVCAGDDLASNRIMDLQLRLIDKSLVIADTGSSEPRYHMLETIREYALEKLEESNEAEELHNRYLDFFVAWGEQAELGVRDKDFRVWLDRMDKERDNLRAALSYAIDSGQPESALRLIGETFWVWGLHGPWSEGQKWAEAALSKASFQPTAPKAKALLALAMFLFWQSDLLKAQQLLEQSITIWQALEDSWWYTFGTLMLGFTFHRAKHPSAHSLLLDAVQMARDVNDKWLLAICLLCLGQNEFYRGNIAKGRVMTEESLALIHTLGDHMLIRGDVLCQLGEIADAEHDYANALRWYEEGLVLAREVGDMDTVVNLEFDMGRVFQMSGENDQAAHLFIDVLQESLRIGKKSLVTSALAGLGVVAQAHGDSERAIRLLCASESIFDNLASRTLIDPMDRAWLDEHIAAVTAQLSEDEFSALSKEGQAMTLEQAVRYALEETEDG